MKLLQGILLKPLPLLLSFKNLKKAIKKLLNAYKGFYNYELSNLIITILY